MASGRTGTIEKGTYIADLNKQPRFDDEQNIQTDNANANADDETLGIKREKRLNAMRICSLVTIVVSLLAIVVGILALTSSSSRFPYILAGGAIAGGMALLFTIFPLCMYCEGKKTKSGNKMTSTFQCCIVGLLVWFSVSFCGIAIAWGMSGVWGMVECLQEKQMPGSPIYNACADRTDEKLVFSVLTFVLSSVLLILLIVISCIVCCNTKLFGYKTVQERRYELYVRNIARDEIEREKNAQRNQRGAVDGAMGWQETSVGERRYSKNDNYNRHIDTGARESDSEAPPPSYDEVVDKYLKADDV